MLPRAEFVPGRSSDLSWNGSSVGCHPIALPPNRASRNDWQRAAEVAVSAGCITIPGTNGRSGSG
jgi:hypothetical protein